MGTHTTKARRSDPVIQFSVFTPNRLGRLKDLVSLLANDSVHVLGMMVLDTTDSAIIRLVVDDPDRARELLFNHGFPFTESPLVVVETAPGNLAAMMGALLEAELNINYLYAFIPQAMGRSLVGVSLEDNDLAEHALRRHHFHTFKQSDISR